MTPEQIYKLLKAVDLISDSIKSDASSKKDGKLIKTNNIKPVPDFSARNNIWKYSVGFNDKTGHPAVFPENLSKDHILSWSNPNDIVLDPMAGSGTVAKVCERLNRRWLACEVSEKYAEIAAKRIESEASQLKLFT